MLAVIFLIWWSFGNPPLKAIFITAALIAGFLLWCAEFVRSIPKFKISQFEVQRTSMTGIHEMHGERIYIQLLPECLTDAPVAGCKAYLIRVQKKEPDGDWSPTAINEVSFLKWSTSNEREVTLEPSAERRLNVCSSGNMERRIVPEVDFLHGRAVGDLVIPTCLSFDIKVTATGCPPVFVSLEVAFEDVQWDKPACVLRQRLTLQ